MNIQLKSWHIWKLALFFVVCKQHKYNFLHMNVYYSVFYDGPDMTFSYIYSLMYEEYDGSVTFHEWHYLYEIIYILGSFCEWNYMYKNITSGPSYYSIPNKMRQSWAASHTNNICSSPKPETQKIFSYPIYFSTSGDVLTSPFKDSMYSSLEFCLVLEAIPYPCIFF